MQRKVLSRPDVSIFTCDGGTFPGRYDYPMICPGGPCGLIGPCGPGGPLCPHGPGGPGGPLSPRGPNFQVGQVLLLLVVQGVFLLVVLILKDILHHLVIHHLQDLRQAIHQFFFFLTLQVFGDQVVVIHQDFFLMQNLLHLLESSHHLLQEFALVW